MDSEDLVSRGWLSFVSMIFEDLIGFHGGKLKLCGILPFGVAIALINLHSMSEVSRYFITIFELGLSAKFPNSGKVGKPKEILLPLG